MTRPPKAFGSKLLVLAPHFPPSIGGSETLLYNLFSHFPRGSYAAVTQKKMPFDPLGPLPCPYYYVPSSPMVYRITSRAGLLLIPLVKSIAYRALRREKATALFLNIPDGFFVIAGWHLAKRLSLPYYVYLHDLWEENERSLNAWMARRYEQRVLAGAKKLFTITDMARQYYLQKYGIDSEILPHCIDPGITKIPPRSRPRWTEGTVFRVLTSGSFYEGMNLGALRSLKDALIAHPGENIELRISRQVLIGL